MSASVQDVTIYHNPTCATSRKVLGLLRDAGIEPRVIEYLKAPPDRTTLCDLIKRMGISPRQMLRRQGKLFTELGLDDPNRTDDALLDALLSNPILMERPIVVTAKGTAICRPAERVAALLP